MDDVLAVQVVHGRGDGARQPGDFRRRQRCAGGDVRQAHAFDAFHDEPGRPLEIAAGDQARHMRPLDPAEDHLLHLEADQAAGMAAEAQPGDLHQKREGRRGGCAGGVDGVEQGHAAFVQRALDAKAAHRRSRRENGLPQVHCPVVSRHASCSGKPAFRILFAAASAS